MPGFHKEDWDEHLDFLKKHNPRLRVFDWNSRWFWLTVFYEPQHYGKPYLTISLWKPHGFSRWVNLWQWEETPLKVGAYAPESRP